MQNCLDTHAQMHNMQHLLNAETTRPFRVSGEQASGKKKFSQLHPVSVEYCLHKNAVYGRDRVRPNETGSENKRVDASAQIAGCGSVCGSGELVVVAMCCGGSKRRKSERRTANSNKRGPGGGQNEKTVRPRAGPEQHVRSALQIYRNNLTNVDDIIVVITGQAGATVVCEMDDRKPPPIKIVQRETSNGWSK